MKKKGNWLARTLLVTIAMSGQAASVELNFSGTLVDRQCTFAQGDDPLEVDMLSRSASFFHRYQRTETIPFYISLKNCTDASQGKLVTITFSGTSTESVGGVNLLKTNGGTGILIGIESASGQVISIGSPINTSTIIQAGSAGENLFRLGAYAQGPSDLSTLSEGAYTATATFEITYR